jgi:hypothetical protein
MITSGISEGKSDRWPWASQATRDWRDKVDARLKAEQREKNRLTHAEIIERLELYP